MSPTSCQTAPPRARSTKQKNALVERGNYGIFRPSPSTSAGGELLLHAFVPGESGAWETLRGTALENRLRERPAVDVLELSADRQAAGDARPRGRPARNNAHYVRGRRQPPN